jgi:hypothetical protein
LICEAHRVLKETRVLSDQLVHKGSEARKAFKGLKETKVTLVQEVYKVQWALTAHQEHLDYLD